MNKEKIWLPYIAGITMASIFGLTFIFTKRGLESLTPMVLLSYRFSIAAIVLSLLRLFKIIKVDYRGRPVKNLVILSLFYPVLSFMFETIGIQYTSTSEAGIMISLMPIIVMVLSIIFLKENPTNSQKIFVFSSVLGVVITVVFSKTTESGNLFGLLLLIVAVFAGAIYNILSRKHSKEFSSIEITFVMIWIGAIFFTSAAVIQGLINKNLYETYIIGIKPTNARVTVLYLSILASIIAFFAMNYMLAKLPAVNASVFVNLSTVISIFAGVIFEKEILHWYQIIGGFFIILGVWGTSYIEARNNKKLKNEDAYSN